MLGLFVKKIVRFPFLSAIIHLKISFQDYFYHLCGFYTEYKVLLKQIGTILGADCFLWIYF